MTVYDDRAMRLHIGVKHDELNSLAHGCDDYSEEQMRQSIVHTRSDMVLLVSHLSSLNQQVATMRRLLWVGLGAAVVVFVISHL